MKKILVAYDGGEPSRKACALAIELATKMSVPVTIVSVVPLHYIGQPMPPADDPRAHAQELDEARAMFAAAGLEVQVLQPVGDPAKEIEWVADQGGFDTIVMGSRHLDAVSRAITGSVSEHVATHANATVVVAR
jgi:nucleotide-binding universal stress UspA family protein